MNPIDSHAQPLSTCNLDFKPGLPRCPDQHSLGELFFRVVVFFLIHYLCISNSCYFTVMLVIVSLQKMWINWFICVYSPMHLSTARTHTLTHIQCLPGRPPRLTGLVNHLHNINGETFVTSNAGLTQHLFNCPQGKEARRRRVASQRGQGVNFKEDDQTTNSAACQMACYEMKRWVIILREELLKQRPY